MVVANRPGFRASRARGRIALVGAVAATLCVYPGTGHADEPAPAVPSVQEQRWVPSTTDSDGDGELDLIHVTVTRPSLPEDATFPVVVQINGAVSPVGAPSLLVAKTDDRRVRQWVAAGFAVATVDNPGIGRSTGCTDAGGPVDLAAGEAVLDHLAGRTEALSGPASTETVAAAFSNGKIALVGGVRSGSHPVALAAAGIPGVAAVVAVDDIADQYNHYRWPGVGTPDAAPAKGLVAVPLSAACAAAAEKLSTKATADRTPFWADRSYLAGTRALKVPTLILQSTGKPVTGAGQAMAIAQAATDAKTPHQINLVADATGAGQDELITGWLNSYLVGPPPIAIDPVRVERSSAPDPKVDVYAVWPDQATVSVPLSVGVDGELVPQLPSARSTKSVAVRQVAADTSVAALLSAPITGSLLDSALVSPPLAADLRVSGAAAVTVGIDAPADSPVTPVLVSLTDTGAATFLAAGSVQAAPGTGDRTVVLDPADVVVRQGNRLALVLIGGVGADGADAPLYHFDAGRIDLPVVGGEQAAAVAFPVTEPVGTEPATTEPATSEPATTEPATTAPVTVPSTSAPGTSEPTAPSTGAPSTSSPETSAPSTDEPSTAAPSTSAPSTDEPTSSAPATGSTEPSVGPSVPPVDCFPDTEPVDTDAATTGNQAPGSEIPSSDTAPSGEANPADTDGSTEEVIEVGQATSVDRTAGTDPADVDPAGTASEPTDTTGAPASTEAPESSEAPETSEAPESAEVPGATEEPAAGCVDPTDPVDPVDPTDPVEPTDPAPLVPGPSLIKPTPSWQESVLPTVGPELQPGLSMSFPSGTQVDLSQIPLSGKDQVITGNMSAVRVNDGRDNPGNWNITGQVSDFRGPNGIILADNLGWAPTVDVVVGGSTVTATPGPTVEPGKDKGLGTFRVLCSSANAVAGLVDCGGSLNLGVPSTARIGEYTATLTLTLI